MWLFRNFSNHYYNQETELLHHSPNPMLSLCSHTLSAPLTQGSQNCIVNIVLSFWKWHINEIKQYVTYLDWCEGEIVPWCHCCLSYKLDPRQNTGCLQQNPLKDCVIRIDIHSDWNQHSSLVSSNVLVPGIVVLNWSSMLTNWPYLVVFHASTHD